MKILSFTYLLSKNLGRSRKGYAVKSPEGFRVNYVRGDALTSAEIKAARKTLAYLPKLKIEIESI